MDLKSGNLALESVLFIFNLHPWTERMGGGGERERQRETESEREIHQLAAGIGLVTQVCASTGN